MRKTFTRFTGMALAALMVCSLAACGSSTTVGPDLSPSEGQNTSQTSTEKTGITGLKLSKSSVTLKVGGTEELSVMTTPADADQSTLVWTVTDPTIAQVENGKITALKNGTTVVTVKTADGAVYQTCTVVVSGEDDPGKVLKARLTAAEIKVTGIALNKDHFVIKLGGSAQLSATATPDNATDKTLSYSSSDETIAQIGTDGKITTLKEGVAEIIVTASSGIKKNCLVIVCKDNQLPAGTSAEVSVKAGESLNLATVDTYCKNLTGLTYTSGDKSVLTMDGSKATGVKEGKVTVTVTDADKNPVFTFTVNVTKGDTPTPSKELSGIRINEKTLAVEEGKTITVTATLLPEGVTAYRIFWISEAKDVFSVDENGVITGIKEGKGYVTAYVSDGKKSFTSVCEVEVYAKGGQPSNIPATGIKLNERTVSLKVGDEYKIEYTLTPADATSKVQFIDESKNMSAEGVISLDKTTGTVQALKAGKTAVTLYVSDGITATIYITVVE